MVPETELKKKKRRNPLDEMMEELEKYSEDLPTEDLMSSGE
ncbi:MAG TPA: hypothetical protein VJH68_04315 [Candidatus Nanoarchaeia archaeon]|nr:hypothetical protein [Candidatus Nanoarchaeia archaeon]